MKRSFDRAGRRAQRRFRKAPPTGRYRYVRMRWRLLFALIDSIGWMAWTFWRRLSAGKRSPASAQLDPRRILLVQLDHLGDAVLTAAVLPALRRRFPHARLEVLAAEWNRELFAACPEIDRLHVSRVNRFARADRGSWIVSTWWWGWRLRKRKFDLAIDVRGEFPHALILWLSGAERRLGWDCGGGGFLLTDRAKFVPGRPEIKSRLALFSKLGIAPDESILDKRPWIEPGSEVRARVRQRLHAAGQAEGPLYVLHVGAGTQAKRWPAEHWRELLGRLIVQRDARVVLIGVGEEREVARAITGRLSWPNVVDLTGRLSLLETAALIAEAELFIGADSGPAHLAAAVGTPAVVLFSGTNRVEQWRPWGARVAILRHEVACSPCHRQTCPWADHPCMTRLAPAAVLHQLALFKPVENLPRALQEQNAELAVEAAPALAAAGEREGPP